MVSDWLDIMGAVRSKGLIHAESDRDLVVAWKIGKAGSESGERRDPMPAVAGDTFIGLMSGNFGARCPNETRIVIIADRKVDEPFGIAPAQDVLVSELYDTAAVLEACQMVQLERFGLVERIWKLLDQTGAHDIEVDGDRVRRKVCEGHTDPRLGFCRCIGEWK